jgi:hypothetical protein
MAFLRYESMPVIITIGGVEEQVFANNVTVTENLPLTAVRSLGFNGAVSTTSTGPIDGTWSITYIPVAGGGIGSECKEINGTKDTVLLTAPTKDFGQDPMTLLVGSSVAFTQGAATSYSITVEPNAVIAATVEGNFYDPNGINVAAGDWAAVGGVPPVAGGGDAVAHGSTSGPDETVREALGWSTDPFTATYSATRGLTPIYTISKLDAAFVVPTDPTETVTMQGDNISKGTLTVDEASEPLCLEAVEIAFSLNDVCGTNIETFDVCGFVQSRDIAIAENDVLRGNVTIVDYNYAQDIPES